MAWIFNLILCGSQRNKKDTEKRVENQWELRGSRNPLRPKSNQTVPSGFILCLDVSIWISPNYIYRYRYDALIQKNHKNLFVVSLLSFNFVDFNSKSW